MTAPSAFSPGDRVRLKSGGLLMTIEAVDEIGHHCVWFDAKQTLQRNIFPAIALEREDEESPVAVAAVYSERSRGW